MPIPIKNDEQVQRIRESCSLVAQAHELLQRHVKPGITTGELDKIAEEFILSNAAVPSFKGYRGFAGSICTSINNEVIHGIPGIRKLKDGDILSIDIGVYKNGFHGDAARTHGVGTISEDAAQLIKVTKQSFFEAMRYARNGRHLYEMSAAVEDYVSRFGYTAVRDFVGHGIGKRLHEDPQIPHFRQRSRGPKLYKNMTLCVEPMINAGVCDIDLLEDGWTVVTRDGKSSAHYENTFVITDGEPELLTLA